MRLGRRAPALAAGLCVLGLAADAAAGGYRDVVVTHYPAGSGDDLLTAGLGAAGLQGAAPVVTDPTDPAQLRRLAIYNNYRPWSTSPPPAATARSTGRRWRRPRRPARTARSMAGST